MLKIAKVEALPVGRGATVQLNDGSEIALFNVGGRFYAIENFCPHKGATLADSHLRGNLVECKWHGWVFDVSSGKCLTERECSLETYEVRIEEGWIKILV